MEYHELHSKRRAVSVTGSLSHIECFQNGFGLELLSNGIVL